MTTTQKTATRIARDLTAGSSGRRKAFPVFKLKARASAALNFVPYSFFGKLILVNFKSVFSLLASFLLAGSAFSCEFTEEYIEARNFFAKQISKPYIDCTKSVSDVEYWYRFSQCYGAGDGEDVGGGCGHVVALSRERYKSLKIDDNFCSVLNLTVEKKMELMEQYAKDKKIAKCK